MTLPVGASEARRPSWTPPLTWLPEAVLWARGPLRSIAVGWAMAFPASILLGVLVQLLAPDARGPEFPMTGPFALFMLVVFAPVLETLIMGTVLLALLRFMPPTWAVVTSALGWAAAHSLAAPIWGLIIWWPFLVFSTLFVAWRSRSLALAFVVPMVTHALQNLPPALLVASGQV